jgi:23S rRNA (adenine2030-N6)-methyltransferase
MHYRHAYHAGNFADVWKHCVLVAVLAAMSRKTTPWSFVDAHAGAGLYALDADEAGRTEEWRDGIGRLLEAADPPAAVADLLRLVRAAGARRYPGSPWLAQRMARAGDELIAVEAQADIAAELQRHLGSGVTVQRRDGYRLDALLPPRHRRGLVLIDPPFERPDELRAVSELLGRCAARFGHGVHMLWYARKNAVECDRMLRRVARAFGKPVWHAMLDHGEVGAGRMHACGVAVVNPPYGLDSHLAEPLAWMAAKLARGPRAHHRLEWIEG